jgi:ubiquinone/menaquinone biosynthesis C-methylase UbiE
VGRTRRGRCAIPGLSRDGLSRPYDAAAGAWLAGADPAYRRFADALVAASPDSLAGLRVLDIAAGTGAATVALAAAGATAYALDESPAMLRTARGAVSGLADQIPAVAADALALPFGAGVFDAAVSAFCVNHLEQPHLLLAEASRVVRPAGVVLASTFAEGDDHPAKPAVDSVLRRWGWQPSAWHTDFHQRTAGITATPDRFAGVAARAGLTDVRVMQVEVDTGLSTAAELVAWRLGMAEQATYLSTLNPADRAALTADAVNSVAALGSSPKPMSRQVLLLTARATGRS